MKRHGNIFDKIYSMENLELASKKAQKGKKNYKEVLAFNENKDYFLKQLQLSLINKTYQTSEYEIFTKICGKKEREIYKLPFYPDRICQWAIMLQTEKIFISHFTTDTYSSIPFRGLHLALKRLKRKLKNDRDGMKYCLKIDVKKYYPNIDHEILKTKLERLFKDKDLLWLFGEIIDSLPNGKGLPIGNYTSQYLSNFYLTSFDRWIKECKKIKHYFRYMDDICIFSNNKEDLHSLLSEIREYMTNELKLSLKGNEQVFPIDSRGVDLLGYVIHPNKIRLRKSIKQKFINKMLKIKRSKQLTESDTSSIYSYLGWIKHCNGINLTNKYLRR